MKTKIILLSILITVITNCFAQTQTQTLVSEVWAEDKGSQNFFQKHVTVTDAYRNVYIAGATLNGNGNYDMLVTKYNEKGVEQWTQQLDGNGGGNDFATALFIDASSNVFVTGTEYESSANKNDIIVLKYNSSGTLQWSETYNGASSENDAGGDIAVDGSGYVYVTGATYDNSNEYDFITLRYKSDGTFDWASQWDNVGLNDAANKITINGNVYVTGGTQVDVTKWEYALVKYDAATGSQIGYTISGGSNTTGIDKVTDLAKDASGNIYVTGGAVNTSTGYDCYTIKLDDQLNVLWTATYNGNDNLDDVANSIKVDSQGNVYICGYTTTSSAGKDYVLIKYDGSGSQQWAETYDRAGGNDEATALALKSDNEIIVTGMSSNGDNDDYYTMRYTADAVLIWSIAWNGEMNDQPTDIAIDNQGGIIVAGQSEVPGAMSYVTVKYEEVEAIFPPDDVPCPSSFAFYQNRGQIIGTDENAQPEIKYYTTNHYPMLYFSVPVEGENYRMLSYVFSKGQKDTTTTDTLQRVDLTFQRNLEAADPVSLDTRPVASDKNDQGFLNYFLAQCPSGITHIEGFSKLYYPSIFDNTDALFWGNSSGMKFYIILKPGAETDVNLKFMRQDTVIVTDSTCRIVTSVGSYEYTRPDVFQIDANGDRQEVSFTPAYDDLGNGRVGFTLGSYNSELTLVIEIGQNPAEAAASCNGNLCWSTYYGNQITHDKSNDICRDNAGNIYIAGFTDDSNFPIYSAPPQLQWGGEWDAVIMSFNPGAGRRWVTFYGGSGTNGGGQDHAYGIAYNQNAAANNLYVTGITSSSNLPMFPPNNPMNGSYYQNTNYPYLQANTVGFDAFILRMNPSNGVPSWSNYFGGDNYDAGRSLVVDPSGGVYLLGHTLTSTAGNSTTCQAPANNGFPLCNPGGGAYYQNFLAGGRDAFIARFDDNNHLTWSTYFGSSNDEDIFEGTILPSNNDLYITGGTIGSTTNTNNCGVPTGGGFPFCSTGTSGEFFQLGNSNYSGFISRFSSSNVLLWSTLSQGVDGFQTIAASGSATNSVVVVGTNSNTVTSGTLSCSPVSGGCPICDPGNPAYIKQNPDGIDIYIAFFNASNNNLTWSTFYGGTTDESAPYAISAMNYNKLKYIDAYYSYSGLGTERLYIMGASGRDATDYTFPTVTYSGYYDQSTIAGVDGSSDIFVMRFDAYHHPDWVTLIGGSYPTNIFGYIERSSDVGSAITVDNNDLELYVTGVTGTGNFPPACPPTGNPYCVYEPADDFPNIIISRFDIAYIVGIDENSKDGHGGLLVFPNPADDYFEVRIPSGNPYAEISVYNSLGQKVYENDLKKKEQSPYRIFTSNYAKGIYLVKAQVGNKIFSSKIIIN